MSAMASMSHQRHRRLALIFMFAGSFLVFSSLVIMNGTTTEKKDKAESRLTQFDLKKKKPQKKNPQKIKPRKKRRVKKIAKKAPPPNLSTKISGNSFGLSLFEMDLDGLSESVLGDMDNVVMTEDSVDQVPQVTSRPPLDYPSEARAQGITGYVIVNLLINQQGQIEKLRVADSRPKGVFEDVALNSVRQWNFAPAQYKGKSVAVWATQKIRFEMN